VKLVRQYGVISRTDAWDDNARLLKVGKVRVRFQPNPVAIGPAFRQELKLNEGCLEITTGGADASDPSAVSNPQATLRIWVDANRPVLHITADSTAPLEAVAFVELWRTNQYEAEIQVSDVLLNREKPDQKQAPLIVEPDTLLTDQPDRVGWLHHNIKSIGPRMMAEIQGLTGFPQTDPLLHRTFGAMVTAKQGERLDDRRLRSPAGTSHRFSIYLLTRHPATPEQWLLAMDETIRRVETQPFDVRRAAHDEWWKAFWNRSWIRVSAGTNATPSAASIVPVNHHPVRIGLDQDGGNKFIGELGRVSIFRQALSESKVRLLANSDRKPLATQPEMIFSGKSPGAVPQSEAWNFAPGLTIEASVKPERLSRGGARLVDKITPGGSDGFLLDTHPGDSLRFICGQRILQREAALPAGQWTHVAAVADTEAAGCQLYVNGTLVADDSGAPVRDEAAYVSQMYHLQRFITACAGRGAYPIKSTARCSPCHRTRRSKTPITAAGDPDIGGRTRGCRISASARTLSDQRAGPARHAPVAGARNLVALHQRHARTRRLHRRHRTSARPAGGSGARSYDRNERFPAFWGPNHDWTPDQDHGGVLKMIQQCHIQNYSIYLRQLEDGGRSNHASVVGRMQTVPETAGHRHSRRLVVNYGGSLSLRLSGICFEGIHRL